MGLLREVLTSASTAPSFTTLTISPTLSLTPATDYELLVAEAAMSRRALSMHMGAASGRSQRSTARS